jgi:hypothetical protein
MRTTPRELGTQQPDRRNSPIAWETDEDTETLRESLPDEPVCFFNDLEYADGTIISSGATLLRCDDGLWVPVGRTERGGL